MACPLGFWPPPSCICFTEASVRREGGWEAQGGAKHTSKKLFDPPPMIRPHRPVALSEASKSGFGGRALKYTSSPPKSHDTFCPPRPVGRCQLSASPNASHSTVFTLICWQPGSATTLVFAANLSLIYLFCCVSLVYGKMKIPSIVPGKQPFVRYLGVLPNDCKGSLETRMLANQARPTGAKDLLWLHCCKMYTCACEGSGRDLRRLAS